MGEVAVGDQLLGADGRPTTRRRGDRGHGRPALLRGGVLGRDGDRRRRRAPVADRRPAPRGPSRRMIAARPARRDGPDRTSRRAHHPGLAAPCRATRTAVADLRSRPYVRSTCRSVPLPVLRPYVLGATLGVLGWPAHIPTAYLRASEAQRRALLAGLLDAAGTVRPTGAQRSAHRRRLAADARELVVQPGLPTARCTSRRPCEQVPRPRRLSRTDVGAGCSQAPGDRGPTASVVDVRPVPSVPVRCVQVDSDDHLYLAGRSMIPTHNSTLALDFSRACSIKHGLTSVIFSLEMSKTEITMRLLSAEARVPLHHMRSGHMSDDDWTRLARRMGEVADAPLYIDDSPNMTMMEIRAKARRLKQRHDLRLVVVDYLQLMTSGKRVESRQVEVSEFSRSLKLLAKELEVPVVAISQLNRGPEQRTDKKPLLSDLRESGCLTADTDDAAGGHRRPGRRSAGAAGPRSGRSAGLVARRAPAAGRRTVDARSSRRGVKEVFRLTLASGRTVKASGNHPFLTLGRVGALDDLAPGDRAGGAAADAGAAGRAASAGASTASACWRTCSATAACWAPSRCTTLARTRPTWRSSRRRRRRVRHPAAAGGAGQLAARLPPRAVPADPRAPQSDRAVVPRPRHRRPPRRTRSGCRTALYRADDARSGCSCATCGRPTAVSRPAAPPSRNRGLLLDVEPALADGVVHLLGRSASRPALRPVREVGAAGLPRRVAGRGTCAGSAPRSACTAGAASSEAPRRAATSPNTNVDTLPLEVWQLVRPNACGPG